MGGSDAYCKQFPINVPSVKFECDTGYLNTTHLEPEIGVISNDSP